MQKSNLEETGNEEMIPREKEFWEYAAIYQAYDKLPDNAQITPEQTATILKITKRVVLDLLRSGLLPGSKTGKFWRIKKKDLDDYMELEMPRVTINRHSPGVFRDKFYEIIEDIYNDNTWLDSKKNRDYLRRYAGKMYNCTDILPSIESQVVGDIIDVYLRDTDKGDKYRRGSTVGRVARVLLLILDTIEELEE